MKNILSTPFFFMKKILDFLTGKKKDCILFYSDKRLLHIFSFLIKSVFWFVLNEFSVNQLFMNRTASSSSWNQICTDFIFPCTQYSCTNLRSEEHTSEL